MNKDAIGKTGEKSPKPERLYFLHPVYIPLLSTIPLAVGFGLGAKWLLPLFITVPSFLVMRRWLIRGKVWTAYAEMLLSCLWMSIVFILLCLWNPALAEKVLFKSTEYVEDMRLWIETGGATEGTPALFIPEHLIHMVIIIVASIATAGFVSLYFGAIQMGYMNYYVAWLIKNAGGDPWAYLLAWPIWSVIRVFSFVLLAVVLAQPMLHLFKWKRFNVRQMVVLVILAVILEGIDIVLKILIGPYNQAALNRAFLEANDVSACLFYGCFLTG
jgi:hypothetical protein